MPAQPRNRWYQFSLRTMFVLVAVVAALAAWVARERRQSWHEQQIAEEIPGKGSLFVDMGGRCDSWELRSQEIPQGWRRDLARHILGPRVIQLMGSKVDLDGLAPIAEFASLQDLVLINAQGSDLNPISGMKSLVVLRIDSLKVGDVAPLAGLTNLQSLTVRYGDVTDLKPLANLKQLKHLDVGGTSVSDVTPLSELTKLTDLSLAGTLVTDVTPLAGLSTLEFLDLANTGVTKKQIETLQAALPNCEIYCELLP